MASWRRGAAHVAPLRPLEFCIYSFDQRGLCPLGVATHNCPPQRDEGTEETAGATTAPTFVRYLSLLAAAATSEIIRLMSNAATADLQFSATSTMSPVRTLMTCTSCLQCCGTPGMTTYSQQPILKRTAPFLVTVTVPTCVHPGGLRPVQFQCSKRAVQQQVEIRYSTSSYTFSDEVDRALEGAYLSIRQRMHHFRARERCA